MPAGPALRSGAPRGVCATSARGPKQRAGGGGLGLSAKAVQVRLGHSTITMTLDVYGHLFPSGDDGAKLAAAEAALLA